MFGREREREVLDRLLSGGRGGVLVLHGEAGVGKTALLEYAMEAGRGFRVARTSGVEAEMELPFAALQQLCSPFLDLFDRLPQPQHEALERRLRTQWLGRRRIRSWSDWRSSACCPRRPRSSRCSLSLMTHIWLDHASARALAFVARRLLAEQIVLLFATRQVDDALSGLPELFISPLGHRDARALLESVLPAPLDEPVLGENRGRDTVGIPSRCWSCRGG